MENETVKDFLNNLGSKTPIPGGGAVAAVNGALASAQLKMICEYSKDENLRQKIELLTKKTESFLKLAEEDGRAFQQVSNAYKTKDRAKINASLLSALVPSVKIVAENKELIIFCEENYRNFNKRLSADLTVALANIRASLASAQAMEKTNSKALKDARPEELSNDIDRCAKLLARTDNLLAKAEV